MKEQDKQADVSKHTPGPWFMMGPRREARPDQMEDRLIYVKVNNHTYHIAETFQYRGPEFNTLDGVSIANARLIAAAPDLLKACEAWQKYDSESPDKHPCPDHIMRKTYLSKARTLTEIAIAKAEKGA